MKSSFLVMLYKAVFPITILWVTFLIISLLQIEFEIIRGETNFFMGMVETVLIFFLLYLSFFCLHLFGMGEIDQKQSNKHTTVY